MVWICLQQIRQSVTASVPSPGGGWLAAILKLLKKSHLLQNAVSERKELRILQSRELAVVLSPSLPVSLSVRKASSVNQCGRWSKARDRVVRKCREGGGPLEMCLSRSRHLAVSGVYIKRRGRGEGERPSSRLACRVDSGIISGAGTQLTLLISEAASPAAFCNLPAVGQDGSHGAEERGNFQGGARGFPGAASAYFPCS